MEDIQNIILCCQRKGLSGIKIAHVLKEDLGFDIHTIAEALLSLNYMVGIQPPENNQLGVALYISNQPLTTMAYLIANWSKGVPPCLYFP